MVRVMAESGLVHSRIGTWGYTMAFIGWQGRLSLWLHQFGVRFRWVDFAIMEMSRQDVSRLYQYSTIKIQERRI